MATLPQQPTNEKLLAQAPAPEQLITAQQRKLEALLKDTTVVNNKLLAGLATLLCALVGLALVYASRQIAHDRIPYLLLGLLLLIISAINLVWQMVRDRSVRGFSSLQYAMRIGIKMLWAIASILCILVGWGLATVSTQVLSGQSAYMLASVIALTLAFIFVWQIAGGSNKMSMLMMWTAVLVGFVSMLTDYGLAQLPANGHSWAITAILVGSGIVLYGIVPLLLITVQNFANRVIEEIKELKIAIAALQETQNSGKD